MSTEQESRLVYLLKQLSGNEATRPEFDELFALIEANENEPIVKTALMESLSNDSFESSRNERLNEILRRVLDENNIENGSKGRLIKFWKRIAVAASILLVVGFGSYFLFFNKNKPTEIAKTQQPRFKNDIAPSADKAILTLADGRKIILDDAMNGNLTQQGNSNVIKKDGQLIYDAIHSPLTIDNSPSYNTITTAKGKQYALILPDGTKIWLNAGSSLRFPASFTGTERRVELTGEALFMVMHNDKMPFKVIANGTEIEDLGTEFNVNAYNDEAVVRTTLIEGKVKVTAANSSLTTHDSRLLSPGQQAMVTANKEIKLIPDADINHVVAWKDGLFDFDNDDLPSVIRELSRWYDIDVNYQGAIPAGHYSGGIRRQVNISEVLKMLEALGGVEFSIDGKKIFVKAK